MDYTGRDNLDVMSLARNYNKFLTGKVLSEAHSGDIIVDFGAGAGTFSLPVQRAGHRIVCVEPDPNLSAALARQGLTVIPDFNAIDDDSVDYIFSLNVLEHIEDDSSILTLWHRKLRRGGRIFVYVPAFRVLFTSMDRKVGHVRRYSRNELRHKLTRVGFDVRNSGYADSLGFFATLAYKWIDKGSGEINPRALKTYDSLIFPLSRALDLLVGRLFGKNVYAVATKHPTNRR